MLRFRIGIFLWKKFMWLGGGLNNVIESKKGVKGSGGELW